MWWKILLVTLGLVVLFLLVVLVNSVRLQRANARLVEQLLIESSPLPGRVFKTADLEACPHRCSATCARPSQRDSLT